MSRRNSTGPEADGAPAGAGSCCRAERRTDGATAAVTHAAMRVVRNSFCESATDTPGGRRPYYRRIAAQAPAPPLTGGPPAAGLGAASGEVPPAAMGVRRRMLR